MHLKKARDATALENSLIVSQTITARQFYFAIYPAEIKTNVRTGIYSRNHMVILYRITERCVPVFINPKGFFKSKVICYPHNRI